MRYTGEIENVLEIRPGVFEMKIRKEDEIYLAEDIKVEIVGVEYHDRQKRPKSIVIRISAPFKYPIIRPERRDEDFYAWQSFSERGNKISSKIVRRFFYPFPCPLKPLEIRPILLQFYCKNSYPQDYS